MQMIYLNSNHEGKASGFLYWPYSPLKNCKNLLLGYITSAFSICNMIFFIFPLG